MCHLAYPVGGGKASTVVSTYSMVRAHQYEHVLSGGGSKWPQGARKLFMDAQLGKTRI